MTLLGLDIGSSSLKAGIVGSGKILGKPIRATFPTHYDASRAEVDPIGVLKAIATAVRQLPRAKSVDAIALSVMSPAWIAMDKNGHPLTPLITHQDRRSVDIAHKIEQRVGMKEHLNIAGNRPFPGGISSTTARWFIENHPALMRKADLLGHLNTFLHRQLTGQRIIDPSNASFTGLYQTVKQGTWSDELCDAIGISKSKLPDILPSDNIAGIITKEASRHFGLTPGTPVLAGIIDTSAAMLLTGAESGQLLNVSGSTDVLGLCTDQPHPHEKLLTRTLGVGRKWMSVATLAAAGSSINWMKNQVYPDLTDGMFYKLMDKLARSPRSPETTVIFEPYLAGERTSIDQKRAAFTGLTLSTTRDDMLSAVIEALACASGARLKLLLETGAKISKKVVLSGGAAKGLHAILHRDWGKGWKFKSEDEASLRGLSMLGEEVVSG